ncbi:Molybdopterin synthase sulfur carrier subunit [Flavobacterium sp. 9R]|uniref:MoaD/ThiS family protein n=1 Tax=Flavobacterium sp. 9R TaxID=2653143 RepID=UPI0012F010CA|nr:MoaD/ThiS family protein [Flavobacterium sp. 9R]VXC12469.1 Molybdopterin synthase sulfur carrier subunit [Flavobacterium sp. 9R]
MRVTLKYFGLLAEITHCNEEQMELTADLNTLLGLKRAVERRFPDFQKTAYSIALNQTFCNDEVVLQEADVIAFLPPFAGG